MAITWTTRGNPDLTHVTHEGLVLCKPWSRVVRVMSDIWADEYSTLVWNPEKGGAETVALGTNFELDTKWGQAVVDAPPEIIAAWENQVAIAEQRAREAAQRDYEARVKADEERERKMPYKGRLVTVVKGRKVPVGTKGVVIWTGEATYGYTSSWSGPSASRTECRLGIAISDRLDEKGKHADVVWTASTNVEADEEGNSPEEVTARQALWATNMKNARTAKIEAERIKDQQTLAAFAANDDEEIVCPF